MEQYTNEIEKINTNIDLFFEDYNLYLLKSKPTVKNEDYFKLLGKIDALAVRETSTRVLKVYIKEERAVLLAFPKEFSSLKFLGNLPEEVIVTSVNKTFAATLPDWVLPQLVLMDAVNGDAYLITGCYKATSTAKNKSEIFCQEFSFKNVFGQLSLTMSGKTFHENSVLHPDNNPYDFQWFKPVGEYMVRTPYSPNEKIFSDRNISLSTKKKRHNINGKKNKLDSVFSTYGFNKEKAKNIGHFMFMDVVNEKLKTSKYVKSVDFKVIDVERYQNFRKNNLYTQRLSYVNDLSKDFLINVYIGEDLKSDENVSETQIMETIKSVQNKSKRDFLKNTVLTLCAEPIEPCLYIISSNKEKDLTATTEYKRLHDKKIIQHMALENLSNESALANSVIQLYIKADVVNLRDSLHQIKGDYLLYFVLKENDEKKCYEVAIKDSFMTYREVERDYLTYDLFKDVNAPDYIVVKLEDNDRMSSPYIKVYDTPFFVIPNINKLAPEVKKQQDSENILIPIQDILAAKNDCETDDYTIYLDELLNKYTNAVPVRLLKAKHPLKSKKTLNALLQEKYGVTIIQPGKGIDIIDKCYPGFKGITYSKNTNSGEFFVMTSANPTESMKDVDVNVLKRTYEVHDGENFIEDILGMIYEPFSNFMKLSTRPFAYKYLKEWIQMQEKLVNSVQDTNKTTSLENNNG